MTNSMSCGCGTLRLTLEGRIRNVVSCHCSRCRKFNGSAFSTYAVVKADDLEILAGSEALTSFALASGAARHFCGRCGAPLYNVNPRYPGYRMVHLGAFDDPTGLTPRLNIHCSSRLPWLDREADLPSYPEGFQD